MNEKFNELYSYLKGNGMTDLDANSFYKKYSDPVKSKEIYSYLKSNKMTDLDETSFHSSYFGGKKKEPTASLSPSGQKPTSSVTPAKKEQKPSVSSGGKPEGLYSFPGNEFSVYKKKGNEWFVDTNRSGNFIKLYKGDVDKRISNLEKNSKKLFDSDYEKNLELKFTSTPDIQKEKKNATVDQKQAQDLFKKSFNVMENDDPIVVERKKIDKISEAASKYVNKSEEESVYELSRSFKDIGYDLFDFEEAGMGNMLKITNKKTLQDIVIDLDGTENEKEIFKSFIKSNLEFREYNNLVEKRRYLVDELKNPAGRPSYEIEKEISDTDSKIKEQEFYRKGYALQNNYNAMAMYGKKNATDVREDTQQNITRFVSNSVVFKDDLKKQQETDEELKNLYVSGQITKEKYDEITNDESYKTNKLQLKERYNNLVDESKTIMENNDSMEKIIGEASTPKELRGDMASNIISSFASGFVSLPKMLKQIDDYTKTPTYDINGKRIYDESVSRKDAWQDLLPGIMSDEYTKSAKLSDVEKVLAGMAESIGAAASMPIGGAVGSVATSSFWRQGGIEIMKQLGKKAVLNPQQLGLFANSYLNFKDQINSDPDTAGIDEADKILLSGGYGYISSKLESLGMSKWFSKSPAGVNLTSYIMAKAFKDLPKDATEEMVDKAVKTNVNALIAKGVISLSAKGNVEASTEALQELGDIGIKYAYNEMKGQEIFKNPSFPEIVDRMSESYKLGLLGGTIMSSTTQAISTAKEVRTANQINTLEKIINDPNVKTVFENDLKTKILNNQITVEQAKDQIDELNSSIGLLDKIPANVTDKTESFKLLAEKQRLENEISGKDESLVSVQKARISEINNKLTQISEDANKKDNIQQQEGTTEGSTVEYQRTSEGQPEVGKGEGIQREATVDEANTGDSTVSSEVQQEEIDAKQAEVDLALSEKNTIQTDLENKGLTEEEIQVDPDFISKVDKLDAVQSELFNLQDKKSVIEPTSTEQVTTLRAQEQVELAEAIPNIDEYKVDGEVDKNSMPADVLAKYNEIYDKYDKLITPLLTTAQASTSKNQVTLDNFQELENQAVQEGNDTKIKTLRAARMVVKALPGVKVFIHNSPEEYQQAIADASGDSIDTIKSEEASERSGGQYVNGEIHVDGSIANERTVYHEAFHDAILKAGLSVEMAKGLLKIISDKKIKSQLEAFISQYESSEQNEEMVSELGAIMAEAGTELSTTKLQQFKQLINKLAQKLGLPVMLPASADRQQVVDFINTMSKAIRTGRAVDINNYGLNGVIKSDASGRSKSILSTGKLERYNDHKNVSVKENVPLSEFNGKTSNVFESDRMTGSYIADETGNKMFNFFGGIFFPRITGKWWASNKMSKANNIAKYSKRDSDGYIYGTPIIMKPGSQMSNNDMLLATLEFMKMDAVSRGSGVTKDELISYINKAFNKKKLVNKRNAIIQALNKSKNIESIFDDLEYVMFQEEGYIVGRDGSNILDDNGSKIKVLTFEERKEIVSGILGDPKVTKAKFPSAGSMSQMAEKFTEAETSKSEKLWDIVVVYRTKGNLVAKKSSKSDEFYHKSYPFEIQALNSDGTQAEIEIFMLDGAYNLTDVMPEMVKSNGETFSWDEYKQKIESGKYKSDKVALSQYGRTSKLSYASGEIKKRSKQKVGRKKRMTEPVAGNKLFNEPLKDASKIANDYAKKSGIEFTEPERVTKLDEENSKAIAAEYDKMKNNPTDPEVKKAYDAMISETISQYEEIIGNGYVVEVNNEEPYSSSGDMISDLKDNKRMKIFSTESGFGDDPITDQQREDNPLLQKTKFKDVNGVPLLANDLFRFVHDFFGHAKFGNGFGPVGEENAWVIHSAMYSDPARRAMTSETRGQNSWVNFSGANDAVFKLRDKARVLRQEGKIDEANELIGQVYDQMQFADQKVGLMPEWVSETGAYSRKKQKTTPSNQAVNKAKEKYDLSIKRGNSVDQARESAINDLKKSDWYNNANDISREDAVRDLRSKLGIKEKKSPSVDKITGKPKDKKVIVNDRTALKNQLRLEARAARESQMDLKQKQRALIVAINQMKRGGFITVNQASILAKRLAFVNVDNPIMVERFLGYADKLFGDAEYSAKLNSAFELQKKIKRAIKSDKLQASVVATAKAFSKLNPSLVEDIDTYIENANTVFQSVVPSRTSGLSVDLKTAMDINAIGEYVDLATEFENEYKKKELMQVYKDLVESGVITNDMSLSEIKELVASITNEKEEGLTSEDKKAYIMSWLGSTANVYRPIIKSMLNGRDPFTGDDVILSDKQDKIMRDFLKIDVTKMDVREAMFVVEAMDNFITNKITDGLETVIEKYNGNLEAKKLADSGFKTRSMNTFGTEKSQARKIFGKGSGRLWAQEMMSLKTLTDLVFRGVNNAQKITKAMGLSAYENGVALANKLWNNSIDSYYKEFKKTKPNGEKFMSAKNIYERGMYAALKRTVPGNQQVQDAEFKRKIKLINDSISTLMKGSERDQEIGKMYSEVAEKLGINETGVTMLDIESRVDSNNMKAVDWWVSKWADNYSELADVSQNVYNTILDRDMYYTPDKFSSTKPLEKSVEEVFESGGAFGQFLDYEYDKKSGVLMPSAKQSSMAEGRFLDLNFDMNNSKSLKAALVDMKTATSIRKISGFLKSNDWEKVMTAQEDRDVFRKKIDNYILRSRNKSTGAIDNDYAQALDKAGNIWASMGAARALGGFTQPLKQTIPVLMSTIINSGRVDFAVGKDQNDWISKIGRGISNRGLESQAGFEDANRMMDDAANSGNAVKVLAAIEKSNRFVLRAVLAKPDVFIARSSFISYYKQYMANNGMSEDINYSKPEDANQDALDYAQRMIDRQQNVSDGDLAGELMASNKPFKKLTRNILLPFASFAINQKSRMFTDFATLMGKEVSSQDRVLAVRSLGGLAAEIAVFNAIAFGIKAGVIAIAGEIVPPAPEDEKEKEKELWKQWGYIIGNVIASIISPVPFTDSSVISSSDWVYKQVNKIAKSSSGETKEALKKHNEERELNGQRPLVGREADRWMENHQEEDRFKIRAYTNENMAGTYTITYNKLVDLKESYYLAFNGEYKQDMYGKVQKKYILKEDRDVLKYMWYGNAITNIAGFPSEYSSVNRRVENNVKKKSAISEKKFDTYNDVVSHKGGDLNKAELFLVKNMDGTKSQSGTDRVIEEIEWIKKKGGFDNERQMDKYIEIYQKEKSVNSSDMEEIQKIK